MTTPNPWNHAHAEVSDAAAPLLADVLGLDSEDIEDWLHCTDDGAVVVLAEMSWDISGDEGVPSPWGGESGEVYLAAGGSRYWIVLCGGGDREAESLVATSDADAVKRFLEGFIDGNDENATIYMRPDAHESAFTSPHGAENPLALSGTVNGDSTWSRDEPWVYGEELGSLVFAPARVVWSYVHDVELARSLRTIRALKQHRGELQLLWLAPADEDVDELELEDDEPYVWFEASDEYPRLATLALDNWPQDLEDIGSETGDMITVPALHIEPASETEIVATFRERGYEVRRNDEVFMRATTWEPRATE